METKNPLLGPQVAKALENRYFKAWYFNGIEEAVEQVFQLIPKKHVISWGGSMTASSMKLHTEAAKRNYALIDREKASSPEERSEIMRRSLLCDTYISGTNAITEDGILVNIDGNGNRVAAMCYGPRQVIIVAGINKITATLDDAVARAQNVAAPQNAQRFPNLDAPCVINNVCTNCTIADSICSHILVTRLCKPAGRIKVILVGKELGF